MSDAALSLPQSAGAEIDRSQYQYARIHVSVYILTCLYIFCNILSYCNILS